MNNTKVNNIYENGGNKINITNNSINFSIIKIYIKYNNYSIIL